MIRVLLRGVAVAVGVWLMTAPAVLGYTGTPASNDRIVGPIAISVAIIAMWEVVRGVRLVNVVLGAWLAAAAFVLGYPTAGMVSAALSGVTLLVTSVPETGTKHRYGGGWRSLVGPKR